MPLRSLEPPDAVRTAAALHVDRLATLGAFPPLRDVTREELALVAPHRVYVLPLAAIEGGRLEEAQPVGWRFLIARGEQVVASAELDDSSGAAPSVHGGPYAAATAKTIDDLEHRSEIAADDFELRLLKVPALYIVAAWLVNREPIVVPLAPAPSFLEAGALYPGREFVAVLRGPAERLRAFEEGPSGG